MEHIIKNKQVHLIMLGQDASLLDASSEAAHRTIVYARSFSGINAYVFTKKILKKEGVYKNVFVFGFSTVSQSLYALIRIYKDIQDLKKTGVAVLISTQDPFEIGLLGLVLSWVSSTLLHVQIHTDISSEYMQKESIRSRVQMFLAKIVLQRADRIRVVSRRIESFCIQKLSIKNEKIDFVPMLYTRGVKKTRYVFGQGKQIIVLPARFVWFKRIPLALHAFKRAVEENKNLRLRIVGAGPLEVQIKNTISAYGIQQYVEIVPWMSAEELYQDASLTLISSAYEGWCRVANESIEAGVPVVMTDVGCASDFIQQNKHGIIVPIEDPMAMQKAIQDIFIDADRYASMRDFCVERALTIDSFQEYQSKVVSSWLSTLSQSK